MSTARPDGAAGTEQEEIFDLVARRSGMVFAPNRRWEAEAGLARAMRNAPAGGLAAYLSLVRRDGAALDGLVEQLTVGETHFMRDPGQMELIRLQVIPALKRRRALGIAPRVWSAGCASGEEAYSLAILLEEEGEDEGAFILGTDVSASALRKARAGSYSDWSMRGVTAGFRSQYFRPVERRHVLLDRVRARVRFELLNLVDPRAYGAGGASEMDLILCRNVLIYFHPDTVRRIASRLFDCLSDDGVLITAGGDPPLQDYAPFAVQVTRVGLVYRRTRPPPQAVAESPVPELASGAAPTPERRPDACARVREHANVVGLHEAERMAQAALREEPLNAPLYYLRATLLLALDRSTEAEELAQRALYLDGSLAVAHFLLGTLRRRRGAREDALRSFRNLRDLCAGLLPDEELPAGDGETVGGLCAAAGAEIERLEVALA